MTQAHQASKPSSESGTLGSPAKGAHVWRGPDMATRQNERLHVLTDAG